MAKPVKFETRSGYIDHLVVLGNAAALWAMDNDKSLKKSIAAANKAFLKLIQNSPHLTDRRGRPRPLGRNGGSRKKE